MLCPTKSDNNNKINNRLNGDGKVSLGQLLPVTLSRRIFNLCCPVTVPVPVSGILVFHMPMFGAFIIF